MKLVKAVKTPKSRFTIGPFHMNAEKITFGATDFSVLFQRVPLSLFYSLNYNRLGS